MKYLNTLLYTYMDYNHYSEFMSEMLGTKTPHGYEDKIEFNDISVYTGVGKFVQKAFDAVTIGDGRSNSIETDLTQGNYNYVFEFDSIDEVKDFISKYCKYFDISHKFRSCCNRFMKKYNIKFRCTEYASSSHLCSDIMNKIPSFSHNDGKKMQDRFLEDMICAIENDIKLIDTYIKFNSGVKEKIKIQCKKTKSTRAIY